MPSSLCIPAAVTEAFQAWVRRSGLTVPFQGPPCLRHPDAVHLPRQRVPLKTAGGSLGHKKPPTTPWNRGRTPRTGTHPQVLRKIVAPHAGLVGAWSCLLFYIAVMALLIELRFRGTAWLKPPQERAGHEPGVAGPEPLTQ